MSMMRRCEWSCSLARASSSTATGGVARALPSTAAAGGVAACAMRRVSRLEAEASLSSESRAAAVVAWLFAACVADAAADAVAVGAGESRAEGGGEGGDCMRGLARGGLLPRPCPRCSARFADMAAARCVCVIVDWRVTAREGGERARIERMNGAQCWRRLRSMKLEAIGSSEDPQFAIKFDFLYPKMANAEFSREQPRWVSLSLSADALSSSAPCPLSGAFVQPNVEPLVLVCAL